VTSYDLDETVETACDQPDCPALVDCGEAHQCAGCGDFFCDDHLWVYATVPGWEQYCSGCYG